MPLKFLCTSESIFTSYIKLCYNFNPESDVNFVEDIIEILERNLKIKEDYEFKRQVFLLHNLRTSMNDILHYVKKYKTIDSMQFVELLIDSLQALFILKHLSATGLSVDPKLIYSISRFVEEGIEIDPYEDSNKKRLYSLSLLLIK